ncbi:phage tail tube protein [Azonexus sp.]|uniref:phage tail tube protein n=1 Tax=Azonexus sp. TaxID=1872668 RepID=UPI0035AFBCCA
MGQLTGRAFITVAGRRLGSKEGAKLGFGNLERTAELGDAGVLGYKEKPTVPYVECTICHTADTSLRELADMVDVKISFDTDTRRSYVLWGAWCAKALEIDKGEVSLRFEGMSCEEV